MPVLMASHDKKVAFPPHFNCLDIRHAMVPVMMQLVSCDANTNTSDIMWHWHLCQWFTWPKKAWCTPCWSSGPKEFNGAIGAIIGIMLCQYQLHHMTISQVSADFNHLGWRKKYIWKTAHKVIRSIGRQTSLNWYDTFTWKMVLKRPFVGDTGEDSG